MDLKIVKRKAKKIIEKSELDKEMKEYTKILVDSCNSKQEVEGIVMIYLSSDSLLNMYI